MHRTALRGLARAAACVAVTFAALASAQEANAQSACTLVAAPSGSDSAAGTEAAPFRSAQKLVDSLSSGQAGCLRAGTYDAVQFHSGNVTLRSYEGEKATVTGRLYVPAGSDGVTVQGLYLDGTNRGNLPSPTINARNTTFRANDVSNGRTAICFSLGHSDWGRAVGTTLEKNRVHGCGRLPATNQGHGIYLAAASDTTIRDNWIYDNADRGIQLYPDAQRTTITGNVIDGNGQGIIFSGADGTSSSDTTVERNAITNSRIRNNVESWYPAGAPAGRRNTVRRNCIEGGAQDKGNGGLGELEGFTAADNVLRNPAYVSSPNNDYRLAASSPCRSVLPHPGAVPGPDSKRVAASQRAGVVLRVDRRVAPRSGRVRVRVRVAQATPAGGSEVSIMARTTGGWHPIGQGKLRSDGSFRANPRLRVRRHYAGTVRMRAVIRGVGRSRSVSLRLR